MKIDTIQAFETLEGLKKKGFVCLISLVCEDLSPNQYGNDEFKLTYTLYNPVNKEFQEIETTANDEIQSVSTLFKSANYDEREIYDLFGLKFKNHPNLSRIYLSENFKDHPLRNDYNKAKIKTESGF